jgi:hypothetical protein
LVCWWRWKLVPDFGEGGIIEWLNGARDEGHFCSG